MSLVADVIASTKLVGAHSDSVLEMEKLIKQSEEAKVRVCEALSSHYIALSSTLNDTLNLHNKVSNCIEDIELLDSQIKDKIIPSIEGSASEIETVTGRWKEIKEELKASQLLLDIHYLLDEFHKAFDSNKFSIPVENLNKIENLLEEANEREIESQLDIISAIREELIIRRTDVIFKVGEVWNKFLSFSQEEIDNGKEGISLSILCVDGKTSEIKMETIGQVLAALNSLGELQKCLRSFGKTFLQYFIKPVLCEMGEVRISHQLEYNMSVMYVNKPPNPSKIKDTTSAVRALEMLKMMFHFLNGHLSMYTVQVEEKEVSFISLLGDEIGEEFIKLVLNNCLEESIPTDRKDLECFNDVQQRVEDFHHYLVNIGFYSEDHKSLLNYVSNIEIVYGNKTCSNLLMKARNLMIKSLNITASIDLHTPEGPLVAYDEFGKEYKETSLNLRKLSPNTFNWTKCQVSVSVCELLNLIHDTLEEACVSTAEFAAKLFHTVRNILSMYWHVTPMAHAHTISDLPEHAALMHNNAMFITHHAFLIGYHYMKRVPASLQTPSFTTVDLGCMIRTTGCNIFLKSMQNHKNSLIETIRKGLELNSDVGANHPLHASVSECIEHLRKLRNAWEKILPRTVYVKVIGTLSGSVVEDLVLRIIAREEISSDDAIELINILSILSTNIPPLFSENDEAASVAETTKQVRLWEKLNELIIVLGASLQDLNERWSDGKGPLAHLFTPEEVKHLIRALFQNTERRARLLAKIK